MKYELTDNEVKFLFWALNKVAVETIAESALKVTVAQKLNSPIKEEKKEEKK